MLTAILRLSAGCTSVKGKIWVIYRKFSGKLPTGRHLPTGNLPVIYGNVNIPNLTGNFRTLTYTTLRRPRLHHRLLYDARLQPKIVKTVEQRQLRISRQRIRTQPAVLSQLTQLLSCGHGPSLRSSPFPSCQDAVHLAACCTTSLTSLH